MGIFVKNNFISHSGKNLDWKIDCDGLSFNDIDTLAFIISQKFEFGSVYGIPSGGILLAESLIQYITKGPRLIVDDVLTTGNSMNNARKSVTDIGVVIFSRGKCDDWITPIFKLMI